MSYNNPGSSMAGSLPVEQCSAIWTRNFILLCVANFVLFMSMQVLLPTLPLYLLDIGGDEKAVGFVMGAYTLSSMLIRPFAGLLVDHYNRRKVLLLGLALVFLVSNFYEMAAMVTLLILVRVVHGLSFGISSTAIGTMVADILPKARLGEGMGYFGLTSSLSMALAPMLGLWLVQTNDYSTLFLTVTALALLALLSSLTIKATPNPVAPAKPAGADLWSGLLEKSALPAASVMFFLAMVWGAVICFIAVYAAERGIANIGLFFTANAGAMMVCRPFAGRYSDRHGADKIMFWGHLLIFLSMLIIGFSNSILGFIVSGVISGIGFGACMPTLQALAVRNALPHRRGAATSSFFAAFDLGLGLGTVMGGLVAAYTGYQTMFLIAALPIVLAGLLYYKMRD